MGYFTTMPLLLLCGIVIYRSSSINVKQYQRINNDFEGVLINSDETVNEMKCARLCNEVCKCDGFKYNSNDGVCYRYRNITGTTFNGSATGNKGNANSYQVTVDVFYQIPFTVQ